MSAESGVPTFRGADGLWRDFRAEDLATPAAFARDPQLVWEWYDWRRHLIAECRPNAAHDAIARWEYAHDGDFLLITQNVDGLHQRAGSRRVAALHGDIWTVRCVSCGDEREDRRVPLPRIPPRCERCGGLLRPGVVWFGENLPADALRQAWDDAARCDLMVVVGTSGVVYPAAAMPALAKENGAYLVEVNLERTPISLYADEIHLGRAADMLPSFLPL